MKVVVIGSGIGGLCAAISLASQGADVEIWEAARGPGGKAGSVLLEGVRVDTGPSLLTLPDAFDAVLAPTHLKLQDLVTLVRPEPAFMYQWPDGVALPMYHAVEDSLDCVGKVLGAQARTELASFLAQAARAWEVSAPRFIYTADIPYREFFSPRALSMFMALDPLRSMENSICRQVREPHLRDLLRRYATYNGSHPGRAPATLNCIAHVELSLGGFGVQGGIAALVDALVGVAMARGVRFQYQRPVDRLEVAQGRVVAVQAEGQQAAVDAVVCNADVACLTGTLLKGVSTGLPEPGEASLSGWTGIFRSTGRPQAAHTVLFPKVYSEEFVDLFDRRRPPQDPTVYASAQAMAHQAGRWADSQPLFAMINAPAGWVGDSAPLAVEARQRLVTAGLLGENDALSWSRSPADLAAQFPGSQGALYGSSSNSMLSAFNRPSNRVPGIKGLYLASGSAHPGGGLPLCALSGRAAAMACLADRRRG